MLSQELIQGLGVRVAGQADILRGKRVRIGCALPFPLGLQPAGLGGVGG